MSKTPAPPTDDSLPPNLDHEDALVSGALHAPDEDEVVYTASANTQGDDTQKVGQPTSLEELVNIPPSAYVSFSNDPCAISTAIPDSIGGQSLAEPIGSGEPKPSLAAAEITLPASPNPPKPKPVAKPYADKTQALRTHLPHLNNVLSPGRQKQVKVECYDYSNNTLDSCRTFGDDFYTDENVSLCQVLKSQPPEDVQLRLIVAEDISTELIECLGSSLSISPEVFEEHLLNGGWQNGKYDDPESDTWITHDMVKNYTTLRWYRPVKRTLPRPYSAWDWEAILDPQEPSISWTEAVPNDPGKPYGVSHVMEPSTNILRRDWDLKTDTDAHVVVGDLAAWEERATIWSRQRGSHSIGACNIFSAVPLLTVSAVVLLLDPLPILQDRMSGAEKALQTLGVYASVDQTTPSHNQSGAADSNLPAKASLNPLPKALVRSRTFVKPRERTGSRLINLKAWLTGKPSSGNNPSDQNNIAREDAGQPEDPERGQGSKRRERRERVVRDPRTRSGMARFLARLTGNTRQKSEGVDGAEEPDTLAERVGSERITLEPLARCMYEGINLRGPMVDYDSIMSTLSIELIAEHIDKDRSTAKSLALWIQHDGRQQNGPTHGGPLGSLFAIAQRDTLNVLRLMDLALREIGQHILDDTLIQQRLIHWRHLLERFDTELLQLEHSLRRFAKFIETLKLPNTSDGANSGTAHLLEDCVAQMSTLGQRTKQSYTSLMANMSIVESKRGIAEAESVTKLTELAFFFIPLTFSASIFSMQVKELNSSSVSLSAFFILAIIITTCSYALRLFIRSASVIRLRRQYMAKIRADAGLPPGASIPTTSFLIWVWHRIGLLSAVITVIVALFAVPLAFLWTRDMNHGYQAVLTVLEVVLISVAAYFVAKSLIYTDARGLHFRRDLFKSAPKRKGRKGREKQVTLIHQWYSLFPIITSWLSSRYFLFAFATTIIAVGPVAALWTRPLETGIKVGVTIVFAFIYIAILAFLVLKTNFLRAL